MQDTQETWVRSLDQEDPLEEEMATHYSILAWEIPLTEEPGGLSMWSQSPTCSSNWSQTTATHNSNDFWHVHSHLNPAHLQAFIYLTKNADVIFSYKYIYTQN